MLIMEIFSKEYLLHNLFFTILLPKCNSYTAAAVIQQTKAVFTHNILNVPQLMCFFPRTINANLPYS